MHLSSGLASSFEKECNLIRSTLEGMCKTDSNGKPFVPVGCLLLTLCKDIKECECRNTDSPKHLGLQLFCPTTPSVQRGDGTDRMGQRFCRIGVCDDLSAISAHKAALWVFRAVNDYFPPGH